MELIPFTTYGFPSYVDFFENNIFSYWCSDILVVLKMKTFFTAKPLRADL